jgi:serine phosphatase RsbU (regulator of sigma subunit)
MYQRFTLFILFFLSLELRSQDHFTKEQLFELLKKPQPDTTLVDTYNELAWPIYSYDKPDSSLYFGNKAIKLAGKLNDVKRLSIAHRRVGITYSNKGDIIKSIDHQEESYKLAESIDYKRGMQLSLNNIGVAYLNNELLNKALYYFLKSLRLVEETKDYSAAANLYINCGMIYVRTTDHTKGRDFFLKAKELARQTKDSNVALVANAHLSTLYRGLDRKDSASWYLNEARRFLSDKTPNTAKFNYYLNEGLLLSFIGQHKVALESFIKTIPVATVENDRITLLINIAEEYLKLNELDKSMDYFNQAYEESLKNKMYDNLEYVTKSMASIYASKKDYKKSFEILKLHVVYKDSNARVNRVQQIFRQQLEFDYERKQVADSVRFEQKERFKTAELQVATAKLAEEKSFRLMLVVVLVVIILFAVFMFNRFIVTNKQKKTIEVQKQLVELKNHEILDSINYAKRLQSAILPQLENIKKELNVDILYLPKDIIGGDFYFFEKLGDLTFFAVCDCTGHGIPGAIMSVVCHHALEKSIKEFNLTDPALILNKTREIVIDNLNARHQNIKDGMDCTLIVINRSTNELHWAGAYNPLWIMENGFFAEIKADKQPVAFYENAREFTTHRIVLKPGMLLYLLTDGYSDQFGGPKAKKYKEKTLKQFLISIRQHQPKTQIDLLKSNFTGWKGNLDQIDDVAIAVIKV